MGKDIQEVINSIRAMLDYATDEQLREISDMVDAELFDRAMDVWADDEEDEDEPSDADLELGFNVYMGAYDYDC